MYLLDMIDRERRARRDIVRMMENAEKQHPALAPLVERAHGIVAELESLYDDALADLQPQPASHAEFSKRLLAAGDRAQAIFREARLIVERQS